MTIPTDEQVQDPRIGELPKPKINDPKHFTSLMDMLTEDAEDQPLEQVEGEVGSDDDDEKAVAEGGEGAEGKAKKKKKKKKSKGSKAVDKLRSV
jgi:hypothetical protein